MQIDIRDNFPAVRAQLKKLSADIQQRAIARAINRTTESARTQMVRGITSEFAVKASEVREQISIRRAREGSAGLLLTASLSAFGRRRGKRSRNVILFSAKQTAISRRRVGGVTVRIKKRGGRKLIPGAFIGNQGRTVFQRVPNTTITSRSRYAGTKHAEQIKGVETIDVPQMFNTRRINAKVIAHIRERFPEILKREVDFYAGRFRR